MSVLPPLDPSKVASGSWGSISYGDWDFDWIDYEGEVEVDYNGDYVNYGSSGSLGVWGDYGIDGYSGWYWSHGYTFEFDGIAYDHDALIVLDADNNGIYNSSIDYAIGYAFGHDNNNDNSNSGTWERTDPYDGEYSGGAIGKFIITVALDYEGTSNDDYVVGSSVADNLKGGQGDDDLYGYK